MGDRLHCGICGSLLTPLELALISPKDFTRTCTAHKKYAHVFQDWKVKKDLGLPYNEPEHNCTICGVAISDKDWANVDHTAFQLTCDAHKKYKNHFTANAVRQELGLL